MSKPKLVTLALVDGELHAVWRQRSPAMLVGYPSRPMPDRVWKDVYVCGHDEIVLAETILGKLIPSSINAERIEFP